MATWKCAACGWGNVEKWTECAKCGLPRSATEQEVATWKPQPSSQPSNPGSIPEPIAVGPDGINPEWLAKCLSTIQQQQIEQTRHLAVIRSAAFIFMMLALLGFIFGGCSVLMGTPF